jgi:hypothetical protein
VALMAMEPFLRVPTLTQQAPIVEPSRKPTIAFLRTMNDIITRIVQVVNAIVEVLDIQEQLRAALDQAEQAIVVAQAAADTAQAAAETAQQQADATKREAALTGSYIDPDVVLTASPTLITIAAHIRYYADGTSVAVDGGTAIATAPGEINYISYEDTARAGGMVTYLVTSDPPVQTGDTHVVGAVQIPDTGTVEGGNGPQRPGQVYPNKFGVEPDA